MTFRTFIFLLALSVRLNAAIPADWIMHMEGLSRGVMQSNTAKTGMSPVVSLSCRGITNIDFARFYIVAPPVTNTLSITVDGTNYFAGTNWLKVITETNLDDDIMQILVKADDSTSPVDDVHIFGLAIYAITNSGAMMNIDPVIISGSGSGYGVLGQVVMPYESHPMIMLAHSQGTGGYTGGFQGKTVLWEAVKANAAGFGAFRLRDADNGFALIGEGSIAIAYTPGIGKFWKLEFKAGYIGDPPGAIWFGDLALRYNNTNFLTLEELGVVSTHTVASGKFSMSGKAVMR